MPSELELERRDIPAAPPRVQHPAPVTVPRVVPERAPRLRPGDPVDEDARSLLQGAHGTPSARADDAVDRAPIEAAGVEADLQAGDVGCSAGVRLGGERE